MMELAHLLCRGLSDGRPGSGQSLRSTTTNWLVKVVARDLGNNMTKGNGIDYVYRMF